MTECQQKMTGRRDINEERSDRGPQYQRISPGVLASIQSECLPEAASDAQVH